MTHDNKKENGARASLSSLVMCQAICQSQNHTQRFSLRSSLQKNRRTRLLRQARSHGSVRTPYTSTVCKSTTSTKPFPRFPQLFFSVFFFLSFSLPLPLPPPFRPSVLSSNRFNTASTQRVRHRAWRASASISESQPTVNKKDTCIYFFSFFLPLRTEEQNQCSQARPAPPAIRTLPQSKAPFHERTPTCKSTTHEEGCR